LAPPFSKVEVSFGSTFFKSGTRFWLRLFQKWNSVLAPPFSKVELGFGSTFFKGGKGGK
jgi:hypothetical protein